MSEHDKAMAAQHRALLARNTANRKQRSALEIIRDQAVTIERYRAALQAIAESDYRGNCPSEIRTAQRALEPRP